MKSMAQMQESIIARALNKRLEIYVQTGVMPEYPKAVSGFPGIVAMVNSVEEEASFRRQPLIALCIYCAALVCFALYHQIF